MDGDRRTGIAGGAATAKATRRRVTMVNFMLGSRLGGRSRCWVKITGLEDLRSEA